jgi:hypothetical protein
MLRKIKSREQEEHRLTTVVHPKARITAARQVRVLLLPAVKEV